MMSVGPRTDFTQLLDDKSLMLMNQDLLSIEYINHLVAFKTTNITTKGGKVLPIELWNIILELTLAGHAVQELSTERILWCRRVELDSVRPCRYLRSRNQVLSFERFMVKPNEEDPDRSPSPFALPTQGEESNIDVLITSADEGLSIKSECLFSDLTVPDVICYMEDGRCNLCAGDRFICPGCTRGQAQRFDAFMGCGVDLACPLCMGLDFCLEHKEFLRRYYNEDQAPDEEQEAVDAWIQQRLDEFGYKGVRG
ncbi:uncharacterized protein LY89DRAFT_772164 [Mollisia scopiformis]|uniref:Uncharacterized protein n=1 Tax=Mollisia scopiformis TaxID=149040 RepID=A0A194XIU6_MOLSC|nr:uncharacterized protein LY89DRAFT_772164 [Mollisia scopiformis]KUJ19687.1 hypothetical protein LY89DRAFT_772164 [Mollisia scopiformis]